MVQADDRQLESRPTLPAWCWAVLLVGSACLMIMVISPWFLKGGSGAQHVLWLTASGLSVLGSLAYLIGRYTCWAKYPRAELRFAFTPMILSAVILVGLLLAITIAAILAR